MEIIDTDVKSLSRIIHVSDIHIRKRERHAEYQIVFDRLYDEMRKIVECSGKDDCIIVITGDIMHDKSELVPESINMLKKLLLSLSDIMEVVLIIGNHDVNIFNIGSMDALTPIVSDLYTTHKIHLLTENANYVFGETSIVFGVTTLWAKSVTPPALGGYTNIALYHGTIHGCTLDNGMKALNNGFSTNSSYFNVTDFAGYDAVLLGDIHKHQYMNAAKSIAYAGSLIQQKRDEDLLEHGYILWDVSDMSNSNLSSLTSRFIPIRSDYGMVEIRADAIDLNDAQSLCAYPSNLLPLNLDVKIVYTDSRTKNTCKDIYRILISEPLCRNLIKTSDFLVCDTNTMAGHSMARITDMTRLGTEHANHKPDETDKTDTDTYTYTDTDKVDDAKSDKVIKSNKTVQIGRADKPIAITNNDAVLNVMMGYYDSMHEHHDDHDHDKNHNQTDRDQITKQIGRILKDIGYNYESDVKNIRLKSIEFDNMLIYLAGNRVDFSLFTKIVGLNASNYSGKSSFIDIVLYAIYGQCSRGKRFDMLNILSTKMSSRIVLEVNRVEYIILRTSYINSELKRDLKESITVWENGRNITSDDRIKTQQIIEQKICSYTDMLNNSFILQKNGHSFTDLTDRQKKDLLCKMARLDVFDRVLQDAKSKYFSISQSLGRLTKKLDAYSKYADNNTRMRITEHNRTNTIRVIRSNMVKRLSANTKTRSRLMVHFERQTAKYGSLMQKISSLTTEEKYSSQSTASLKTYDRLRQEIYDRSIKLIGYMDAVFEHDTRFRNIKQDMAVKLKQIEYDYDYEHVDQNISRIEADLQQMSVQMKDEVDRALDAKRNDMASQHKMYYPINLSAADIARKIDEYQHILSNKRAELERIEYSSRAYTAELSKLSEPNPLHSIVKDRICQIDAHRLNIQQYAEQIDRNIRTIEGHNAVLSSLTAHQYNPSCAQCMSNPATKQMLLYSNSIEQISQQNQRIMADIEHVNREISDLTYYDSIDLIDELNCIDEYDRIKQIPASIKKLEASIVINHAEHKDVQHSIITAERDLADYINTLGRIESNKVVAKSIAALEEEIRIIESRMETDPKMHIIQSALQDINHLKTYEQSMIVLRHKIAKTQRNIDVAESEISSYSADFIFESIVHDVQKAGLPNRIERLSVRAKKIKDSAVGLQKKVDSITRTINGIRTDVAKFDDLMRDINKESKRRIVLDSIKSILDKSGLVDRILSKNIIPYLQSRINNILSSVGHYKISIKYVNRSVNIYKDSGLNISMSSGYESYLLDLVFRLALVQINNHVRTDFLIIDEGFNACDDEHKHNIKDLLEYMRSYYSWILIISHDPFIKSFYDQSIGIQSVEKNGAVGSYISNVLYRTDTDSAAAETVGAAKTVKSVKSVKSVKPVKTVKSVKPKPVKN